MTVSLLLLSSSAEAAVAESKRFERGSRQSSSLSTTTTTTNNHHSLQRRQSPSPSASSSSSSPSSSNFNYHHSLPIRSNLSSPFTRFNHHRFTGHHPIRSTASHPSVHSHLNPNPNNSTHPVTTPTHPIATAQSINNPPFNLKTHQNLVSSNESGHELKSDEHLFKCEKCPKVYRHPQCLVKHRWEHTSYWADASKLYLSKHQQVQVLEAAAILAAPSGSLPESRSLWPAAVSPSEAGLLGSDQVNLDVIRSRQSIRKASASADRRLSHYSPYSTSYARSTGSHHDIEMNQESSLGSRASDEDLDEGDRADETMFEMSLDGDESVNDQTRPTHRTGKRESIDSIASTSSLSGPPPMGYFERRNPQSVSSAISNLEGGRTINDSYGFKNRLVASLPTAVAYQPSSTSNLNHYARTSAPSPVGFVYRSSESIFKPITPYQDSQLRFEGPHGRFRHDGEADSDDRKSRKANMGESMDDDESTEDDDEGNDDGWSRSGEREREGDEIVGMEL